MREDSVGNLVCGFSNVKGKNFYKFWGNVLLEIETKGGKRDEN